MFNKEVGNASKKRGYDKKGVEKKWRGSQRNYPRKNGTFLSDLLPLFDFFISI